MKNQTIQSILLSLGLLIFFSVMIGNRPFSTPDEGRYVEIPREMVTSHDYVTPRLNGVKYFEKPPLLYWLNASLIKLFPNQTINHKIPFDKEGLMRFWPMFFAWLGCMATFLMGRHLYGHKTGILSASILATMLLYYALGRIIILDMVFSILLTLSLYCFLYATDQPKGTRRRLGFYGFSVFIALSVLTKGIAALGLAGPIIVIWATVAKQWRKIWPAYIPSCLFIFIAIAAPWHYLAAEANPDFLYKYFYVEHFLRYTTKMHQRYQPAWFFIPIILLGLFPWTSFLGTALKKMFSNEPTLKRQNMFLLVWVIFILVFFSLSSSKLIPYILPCFPPLSLIIAYGLSQMEGFQLKSLKKHVILFHTVLIGAGFYLSIIDPTIVNIKANHLPFLGILCVALFIYLIGGVALAKNLKHILTSTFILGGAVIGVVAYIAPIIQKPSIKPIAETILNLRKGSGQVISYKTYYQDLPVYLNEKIMVVDYLGELDFGYEAEIKTHEWMIMDNDLAAVWKRDGRHFLVCQHEDMEKFLALKLPHHIVQKTERDVLISNQADQ